MIKYKCKVCGKYIESYKSQMKSACSLECRNKLLRTGSYINCSLCGKSFYRPKSKQNNKSGFNFCSVECKSNAQTMHDKFRDMIPKHYGNGKNSYRAKAFNNLEHKCKDCGETRKYMLVVHHKDGNRNNNLLDNLEILCHNCHTTKHLIYIDGELIYMPQILTKVL